MIVILSILSAIGFFILGSGVFTYLVNSPAMISRIGLIFSGAFCLIQSVFMWYLFVESRRQNIKMQENARLHQVTGLMNRQTLIPELATQIANASRYKYAYGIIIVGMDRFSEINSRFGEKGGDSILHQIADMIRKSCRAGDIVSHFEGDQILIGATHCDNEGTLSLTRRLQSAFEKETFYAKGGQTSVTACMGAVVAPPAQYDPVLLVEKAVIALKSAKERGIGKIVFDVSHLKSPAPKGDSGDDSDKEIMQSV